MRNSRAYSADILDHLQVGSHNKTVFVPSVLVPTLHFYRPAVATVGYNENAGVAVLVNAVEKQGQTAELLCPAKLCEEVRRQLNRTIALQQVPITRIPETGEPMYSMVFESVRQ